MNHGPIAFPARRGEELYAEGVALAEIAERFGTPCFVYSRAALTEAYRAYEEAFRARPTLICFSVKSNSNLAVLSVFAKLGAGFDIVSGGELTRVLAAGGQASKVIFSGVGKSAREMEYALKQGILCFNVESRAELLRLDQVAGRLGIRAAVSVRVNPDVDAKTHPYIATGLKASKFGVPYQDALSLYQEATRLGNVKITGIDCHIGSQITEVTPFADALERLLALVDRLNAMGIALNHVDLGGGVGIRYRDEEPIAIDDYAKVLLGRLAGRSEALLLEPGRRLVGNAGVLLTRVEYLKHGVEKNFAIVDAAMNDLLRPALYHAYHEVLCVRQGAAEEQTYDVVGPVCESADFLARERKLRLAEGDYLALLSCGAYGAVMSSNYNTRPRAAEVLVDGTRCHVARERESVEQLLALEHPLP
jgi:diaminopimelate decarboxylase